jgi:hypothetical protein
MGASGGGGGSRTRVRNCQEGGVYAHSRFLKTSLTAFETNEAAVCYLPLSYFNKREQFIESILLSDALFKPAGVI